MKETDLAKLLISWLADQHWEIYQEVQFDYSGWIADVVAVRGGIMWIIETKMAYTLDVLRQASRWAAHYRSVAVPMCRNRNREYRVAEHYYRVGVIELKEGDVWEAVKAPLIRENHRQVQAYRSGLTELHKTFAEAGSRGGYHLTPYKQTMIEVRKVVEAEPGCTVKDLYERLGDMHYANAGSFKGNLVKALVDFERDWCRVDTSTRPYRIFPVAVNSP